MIELVKTMNPEIIERIVEIEAEAFGPGGLNVWYLEPLIRHGRVYIYRLNNEIVGLVNYMLDWDNPKKAYMVGVSISKESRGQGIGAKLLTESFAALTKETIEEVELTVDPNNVAAVRLYEKKLGFLATGFKQDEYGKGEGRLVMKLLLTNFAEKDVM
ncbi:GNAT family N-acetyltransferase [Desulfosporosinus sp. BG]|uniref:GNAT family N-acetyltransferase n=1 Tax=Desulfosporosinus sp. BG TaxID=1633135 RepID=UPI00083B3F5F|nr:GNAT family N-acetyltransferase [Desulfosporosinus sp. BG]ODA40354.1 acetyltransferase (GNAT) family protein [Desulfosporosinus sp. BG]